MNYFKFKGSALYCENVGVKKLAREFGTPLYVYSQRTLLEHFDKLQNAFASLDPLICYSVKVNSNLAIMKLLVDKGAGLDIVSGGELYRAKKTGCPAQKVVYASVGKTEREIEEAIDSSILMFNVESIPELKRINKIATRCKKQCNVALRFNPDVDAKTHAYITTGKHENKFGIDEDTIKELILKRYKFANVNIVGIHMHIGSQIVHSAPYVKAIKRVSKLFADLKKYGIHLSYLNIGGGLGIVYDKEKPQTASTFAKKVMPLLKRLNVKVILEPGRFIAGNAGILVGKVLYIKETPKKRFVIVDAAMNDLIRPSLYGAYHNIEPVVKNLKLKTKNFKSADIVGPVCESGDFLGKNRKIQVKEGEYISVFSSGAYAFSMSSNYNSRPRAAEILVDGSRVRCIRQRESYEDLIDKEKIS
jgi:diaminopimelate decarboxylase